MMEALFVGYIVVLPSALVTVISLLLSRVQ